tara:strand:+ start:139 stop:405 length:267 start_codon:yes stop_codon:yes gene_type:complete
MDYVSWYQSLSKEKKKGYKIMYPDLTYKNMYNRMIQKFGLILSPPLILSLKECNNFKKNPNINPITKRKIKKGSKTYKKIKKAYEISI